MVKEVTAYKDEITGKIFETFEKAKVSESRTQRKIDETIIGNFVDNLAVRYGFYDWSDLIFYLHSNSSSIPHNGVKLRIDALAKRGVLSFPKDEIETNLEKLVIKALSYIKNENVTVKILVGTGKLTEVKSYEIKEHDFDETKVTFDFFNPKLYYLGKVEKKNNEILVYFYNYPTHEADFMKTLELLDKYKIKDCYEYMSIIKFDYVDGLTKADIYRNLSNSSVNNWGGYDYAIELAEEDEKDWSSLKDEEKLSYLEAAGVDNWSYYYEAKSSGFDYDYLNESLQYEYFKDNEDLLANEWENYTKFKKELYGIK